MYNPEEGPLDVARDSGKAYIATRIHDLLYKDANATWSHDGRFMAIAGGDPSKTQTYKF